MLICQTIHTNFLLCPSHSQSSRVTWWIQPRLTWVQTNSGGVRVRINCTSLRMKAPRETEVVKPHGTGSAVLESFTVYWLCPEDELTSTTVQLHRPDDITDRQQGTNDANKDTADLQRDGCSTTQTSRRYWPAARPARNAAPRLVMSTFSGRSSVQFVRLETSCIRKLLLHTPPSHLIHGHISDGQLQKMLRITAQSQLAKLIVTALLSALMLYS